MRGTAAARRGARPRDGNGRRGVGGGQGRGFFRSVAKAYFGSWEADVTPGAYTTCRTAPPGYSWYTWYGQKPACDTAQLVYNRATDVRVSFYPLQ